MKVSTINNVDDFSKNDRCDISYSFICIILQGNTYYRDNRCICQMLCKRSVALSRTFNSFQLFNKQSKLYIAANSLLQDLRWKFTTRCSQLSYAILYAKSNLEAMTRIVAVIISAWFAVRWICVRNCVRNGLIYNDVIFGLSCDARMHRCKELHIPRLDTISHNVVARKKFISRYRGDGWSLGHRDVSGMRFS